MSDTQQINIEDINDVSVVRFVQERIIDESDIQQLGEELYSLATNSAILLNFEDVKFLSSAALGKLIKLDKKVKENNGKLVMSNIRPEIYDVFTITRLHKVFVIADSQDDALAGF